MENSLGHGSRATGVTVLSALWGGGCVFLFKLIGFTTARATDAGIRRRKE
jgi:hypothetical protein